jgi:hypothetical protein
MHLHACNEQQTTRLQHCAQTIDVTNHGLQSCHVHVNAHWQQLTVCLEHSMCRCCRACRQSSWLCASLTFFRAAGTTTAGRVRHIIAAYDARVSVSKGLVPAHGTKVRPLHVTNRNIHAGFTTRANRSNCKVCMLAVLSHVHVPADPA